MHVPILAFVGASVIAGLVLIFIGSESMRFVSELFC